MSDQDAFERILAALYDAVFNWQRGKREASEGRISNPPLPLLSGIG